MGILCLECNKEFTTLEAVRKHRAMVHKVGSEDTYVKYILNGDQPKCECGCGGNAPFVSFGKGFSRFIRSHHNRVPGKNNFHKNPESKSKSAKTQSENWGKGLYRRWWEEEGAEDKIEGIKEKLRNDTERGEKISKTLTGRKHTEEHRQRNSDAKKKMWDENPSLKEERSKLRLEWMRANSKVKTSNLENIFSEILSSIGLIEDVDYIRNHLVHKIKSYFDFYLPKLNVLIETDGDFYHCNPDTIFAEPKYLIQRNNLVNDKRKNTWAKNHNIQLIRYWESDIKERPDWVVEDLQQKLGIY